MLLKNLKMYLLLSSQLTEASLAEAAHGKRRLAQTSGQGHGR